MKKTKTRKMWVFLLALVLGLGTVLSCENWMVESLLKKKPTAVSGIRVEPKTLSGGIGAPYEIKAIVDPENATDKGIIWTSNNDRVATVSNGLVVFQAAGTAIITAMTRDGNFTDYCTVEVKRTISMSSSLMGEVGGMLSLSVSIPGDEGIADFNLESNKEDVVKVNPDKTLSLLDVGEATIKVTVTDNTIDPAYCLVKVVEAGNLAIRFGATDTGKTGADLVTETFQRIHYYLNDSSTPENLPKIALGNYIDLPNLKVDAYPPPPPDQESIYGAINLHMSLVQNPDVLRLIVVGINPFNNKNGNGERPHIAFQFKGIPGRHRMNPANNSIGGYKGSEMRAYLVGTGEGEGPFYAGLKDAGVPLDTDIIWAPNQIVWKGFSYSPDPDKPAGIEITDDPLETITDKLWLLTAYELFQDSGTIYETEDNQGVFEYYGSNSRQKVDKYNTLSWYWEASSVLNGFRAVNPSGFYSQYGAITSLGVAPAFCVK